jgi:hypothetical protein
MRRLRVAGKLTISIERVRRVAIRRTSVTRPQDEEQKRTRAPAELPRLPAVPDIKEKKS